MLPSPLLDTALTELLHKTRAAAAAVWQTLAVYISGNDKKFFFLVCHFLARFACATAKYLGKYCV